MPTNYVFRRNTNVGAADATDDKKFLAKAFIDNGSIDILCDVERQECIIVGRTGAGKTALLERISALKERVIRLEPENLSLAYLSNNVLLRFLEDLGVNMSIFYNLLWKHVFVVEVLKLQYQIHNEQNRDNFLNQIASLLPGNKTKQDAIKYLRDWGQSFWKDTNYRVKEVTEKLESDIKREIATSGKLGTTVLGELSAQGGSQISKSLSKEEKSEVIHIGQQVVNKVQIQDLTRAIELLNELLVDKKKRYIITIDRLDETWVDDVLRYKLIKSLLQTARDFHQKVDNVKILLTIREDLVERVFRITRDNGYQEEKYNSLKLHVRWNEAEIKQILDRRIDELIKEQYTNDTVGIDDIFPNKIRVGATKVLPSKYIIDRTMLNPRDAILFINECIKMAEGLTTITQEQLFQAEESYSTKRLRSLADEWIADYKTVFELVMLLKGFSSSFKASLLNDRDFEERLIDFWMRNSEKRDSIYDLIDQNLNQATSREALTLELIKVFFKMGVLGVKPEPTSSVRWSFKGHVTTDLRIDCTCVIHPAFWRCLGVNPTEAR